MKPLLAKVSCNKLLLPVAHDRPRDKTRSKGTHHPSRHHKQILEDDIEGDIRGIKVGQNSHHIVQQGHFAEHGVLVDDAETPRGDKEGECKGHIGGVTEWERNCNPDKEPTNTAAIQF